MFAARALDPTIHGGFIAFGDLTVLIGGLPAARIGDPHVCPLAPPLLPPHVGGWIATGSLTVLIGGKGAARQTDTCACCVAPLSTPAPASASPADRPHGQAGKTETRVGHHAGWDLGRVVRQDIDAAGDGYAELHKTDHAAAYRAEQSSALWGFLRHKQEVRAGYNQAEHTTRGGAHEVSGVKNETGVLKEEHELVGGDEDNPLFQYNLKQKILAAEVSGGEPLFGWDDRGRIGIGVERGGEAALAAWEVRAKNDLVMMPLLTPAALAARKFAGVSADMTGAASVSVGDVGATGGGWLYYEDGRINWSIKGQIHLGIGISFELGASVGVMKGRGFLDYFRDEPLHLDPVLVDLLVERAKAAMTSHLLATIPNTIMTGCPTVLIGG